MSSDSPTVIPRYERAQLGTKALQRLGSSLASADPLTPAQEDLYQAFIIDADTRRVILQDLMDRLLVAASGALPRLAVASTGRTKTRATLVEKLRREPHIKLPSIRDVAGIRVVADCSLLELEMMAGVIQEAISAAPLQEWGFGETRLIDRLSSPMFGYRALHLEVRLSGAPAEIQFRTQMQHEWAQFMELLCDRWGREPRYGLPLAEPDEEKLAVKTAILDQMQNLSLAIAETEEETRRAGLGYVNYDVLKESAARISPSMREEYAGIRAESEPTLSQLRVSMRQSIQRLQRVFALLEAMDEGQEVS
ncbi:hypothetical protein AB6V29_01340 [Microbacterium sp. 20-116]|uniref:hypothetical protein n=1 Tax=Microbacterium sp. 20-116 TaxID=3239883 RepID=UPI0034E1E7E8